MSGSVTCVPRRRSYLGGDGLFADDVPEAEITERRRRFFARLRSAVAASDPLVDLDPALLGTVHPGTDTAYDRVISEIPLGSRLVAHDPQLDLALLQMLAPSGDPLASAPRDPIEMHVRTLSLGEELITLGYPGVGGSTITITSGDYSGEVDDSAIGRFWKTSAAMGPGNSGGAAFDSTGRFIGIPTAGSEANLRCEGISQSDCTVAGASLGLILPAATVARWLEAHGYGDLVARGTS